MTHIAEIKKGDHVVFQRVYDQYHVKLFHYFLKRTREEATAKDLTQQSFIKLWQSRHTLSETHTLDTQFFIIASSVFIDHLRSQAVERKYFCNLQDRLYENTEFADAHTTVYETANYLDAISENLPPKRKNVFLLKLAQGYSNKEIAEQLSVSIKTVEEHYSKALQQVRALITMLLLAADILAQY